MVGMPSKSELASATVEILRMHETPLKACDINSLVASKLHIPESILEIEDANCSGTEYAYQMRWVRTDLKNKGLISNPRRGYWTIMHG